MTPTTRARWLWAPALVAGVLAPAAPRAAARPPNLVIILCDDMGWGDLGAFGNPTIRTPRLDRMAAEGQKWTSFYVGESMCTPSRAALLTGRLPIRSGMNPVDEVHRVLYPDSTGGLPASEVTIADLLRRRGYATTAIGKWHLGHLPPFLPMAHGFDHYFGIPYSNDMDMLPIPGTIGATVRGEDPVKRERQKTPNIGYFNVPLMRDDTVAERPADQTTITRRYTEEAVAFMRVNAARPFFLYLAHTMPHIPLFASPPFQGKSRRGRYGDVVEEIDWSVGQVLDTLRELRLDGQTLVVFTSDNGPWLGGVLLRGEPSPRQDVFFYRGARLYALRHGRYKAHFFTRSAGGEEPEEAHDPPLVYDLDEDPGERYDVAASHPEVLAAIREIAARHARTLTPADNQLVKR